MLQKFIVFMMLIFVIPYVLALESASRLPVYSQEYDVKRNPYDDGREALKLAEATNRKVLIEVGGDWCSWCHVLDKFIKDHPKVETRLHQTFVVLKVSISDDNDNAKFMSAFPPAKGYPHMYITDSSGNILYSQDTSDFREDKKYSEKNFMIFFDRWAQDDG